MLRVRMFGALQVFRNDVELPRFPTRKSAALFSLLTLRRGDPIHREVLCARLWADQPERVARKSLRTALWRLRCLIEPDEQPTERHLRIDSQRAGLSSSSTMSVDVWTLCDVAAAIQARGSEPLGDADVRSIESATRLYRGRLLEGECFIDESIVAESERLERMQISLLERLMLHHRVSGNWKAAASTGFEILQLDNCREQVHREIMMCFLAMGDRPAAIRQFDECAATLARELGILPMRETIELHARIRAETVRPAFFDLYKLDAPLGVVTER